MRSGILSALLLLPAVGCTTRRPENTSDAGRTPIRSAENRAPHSTTIAVNRAETEAWVVQTDLDRVSVVNLTNGSSRDVLLGPTPVEDSDHHWAPNHAPRSVVLLENSGRALVLCERSGELVAVSLREQRVLQRSRLCARPVGLVSTPDEQTVLVTCAADEELLSVDPQTLAVRSRVGTGALPWAIATNAAGTEAYVSLLHGPSIGVFSVSPLRRRREERIPESPPRGHRTLAHGFARSLYDVLVHPGSGRVYVAHELHAPDTPQPALDFESSVFAAVTEFGTNARTMSIDSRLANRPGVRDGEFGDVISGPRALALSPSGRLLFVLAHASEDVLVVDLTKHAQVGLFRPLPGAMPEGLRISRDGTRLWIDQRHSGTIAELSIHEQSSGSVELTLERELRFRTEDPMPSDLRLGQRVFHTANDSDFPITTNRWMACATCHPEGTTNRITWLFTQGPRDTPSNAGGPRGFLFRTAARNAVEDYWRTINVEQGGHFSGDDEALAPLLRVVGEYVRRAIPVPVPPTTNPALVAQGRAIFERADTQCAECHRGPGLTDSGDGNPSLDLGGRVLLHDVGSCVVSGSNPDTAHTDIQGHRREACAFDTTALLGLYESAPYMHDGSAATLLDVLTTSNRGDRHGRTSQLSQSELRALVEYLRSL